MERQPQNLELRNKTVDFHRYNCIEIIIFPQHETRNQANMMQRPTHCTVWKRDRTQIAIRQQENIQSKATISHFLNLMIANNPENGSLRNIENLQYKKTAGFIESVHENKWKVQQFSCPQHRLKWYSIFVTF